MNKPNNTLTQRLLFLERELEELNRRRKVIYEESLAAELKEDKAVPDQIANAMLEGPLADHNQIEWPKSLNGIAWAEDNLPVIQLAPSYGWAVVTVDGLEHLGLNVGSLASGVSARIGEGDILFLEHANPIGILYVPYLGEMLSAGHCQWRAISGLADLERFAPGDGSEPNAWYELAHIHVSSFVDAKQEADASSSPLQLVPDEEGS